MSAQALIDISTVRIYLRDYIVKIAHRQDILDSTLLIESRIIDSLNIINLVLFIEATFKIRIGMYEMQLQTFQSIDALAEFIEKKIAMQQK